MFQSTLPRGERRAGSHPNGQSRCFNPRSRAGSDRQPGASSMSATTFQSTLPRGERLSTSQNHGPFHFVSIHAPARGATGDDLRLVRGDGGFNPRSRAGSDHRGGQGPREGGVSIHAPARGATSAGISPSATMAVSIHAPARGATFPLWRSALPTGSFNPRSRAGSDGPVSNDRAFFMSFNPRSRAGSDVISPAVQTKVDVSIHAPARGATWPRWSPRFQSRSFNPRSRAGSDAAQGRRIAPLRRFNPRSRAGSDCPTESCCKIELIPHSNANALLDPTKHLLYLSLEF